MRRNKGLPVMLCQMAYCDSEERFRCHSGLWHDIVFCFWWKTTVECNYSVRNVPCPVVVFFPWNILRELKCPVVIMTHCSNKIVRPGTWLTTWYCCNCLFRITLVGLYYCCASCLWGYHKIWRQLQHIYLAPFISGGCFSLLFQWCNLLNKFFYYYFNVIWTEIGFSKKYRPDVYEVNF